MLIGAQGLSLVAANRGYSLVAVLRLLVVVASPVCTAQALGCRLGSFGSQTQ